MALKNSTLFVAATFFWLLMAEGALRIFYNPRHLSINENVMGSAAFRYDVRLGWFPVDGSKGSFAASRVISYSHNSMGLREDEAIDSSKPIILFIGDSFTWGFDVNQYERFTELLKVRLPNYTIVNAGVNGYGTDQQFLLLQALESKLDPALVFLLYYGENDRVDNSTNQRHGGFYKPYFLQDGDSLKLEGVPVPKGERYFFAEHSGLANIYLLRLGVKAWFKGRSPAKIYNPDPTKALLIQIAQYLDDRGVNFMMGAQSPDEAFLRLTDSLQVPFVDLSNEYRYKTYGGHWTPKGHEMVADSIELLFKSHFR